MNHDEELLPSADSELRQLVAAMCDGVITPPERDRLQERLAAEPQSLSYYISYLDLHAQLQWRSRGLVAANPIPAPARAPMIFGLWNAALRPTTFTLMVAVLGLGILTGVVFLGLPTNRDDAAAEPPAVAEISRTSAAVWKPERPAGGARFLAVGERLELESGLAEVQYYGGARVTLEGPAVLRIANENAAALDRGKAVTRVDRSALRFEVDTPLAKVREQGTEFAIAVANEGTTDVHVLQGKAEVLPAQISRSDNSPQWAVAGERIEVPQTGDFVRSKSENTEALFTCRMPPQGNELRISDKYVQAIREAAPVIYWRFENANRGRVANEMSPNQTLQIVHVPLLPSDDGNYSCVFDDSKKPHYLICRDAEPLGGSAYTVELWCLPYAYNPQSSVLFIASSGEMSDSQMLAIVGDGISAAAKGQVRYLHRSPPGKSGGTDLYSTAAIGLGKWHHIVSVFDQGAMRLYVDGQLTESQAVAPLEAKANFILLGALHTKADFPRAFSGRLDEVAVYNRALTDQEVREHYALVQTNR